MKFQTPESSNRLLSQSVFYYLALVLLIFFQSVADADQNHKKEFVVAYAQDTMSNDWRAAQVRQLDEAFSKYPGIRFIYTDAEGSTAKQIQDIEDLSFQKLDLLMTSPRDAALMTPVISHVFKKGIPVVLITRNILTDDYHSFVAPDDREIAKQAAAFMAKKLNGKGNIIMLKGVPTATTAIARTEGFLEEIKKHPGLKLVAVKTGNYLRNEALKVMDELIADGVSYDAIYAQSDSMASGARLAMVQSGIDPASKVIVGIDYISEARQAIIDGSQTASFVYPTSAKQAVEVALKILRNRKVPKRVKVESQLVTKHNVHEVEPIF